MRTPLVVACAACALALAACESARPVTPDAGSDAATGGTDAGRDAGPRRDSGPGDPCEASGDNAIDTVGCNGGILGATRPANDFAGLCTASDADQAGTCTNTNALCWGNPGAQGICLTTCTPSADTYVSTGDCPTGSRCFDLRDAVGAALCFPDCNTDSDCSSNVCDGEGSCVDPEPGPTPDGGMPDGGSGTDGGLLPDSGSLLPDAGVPAP